MVIAVCYDWYGDGFTFVNTRRGMGYWWWGPGYTFFATGIYYMLFLTMTVCCDILIPANKKNKNKLMILKTEVK